MSKFLISGQGVYIFDASNNTIEFSIHNKEKTDGFHIKFLEEGVKVNRIGMLEPLIDCSAKQLLKLKNIYYWFSLDSINQQLYAGIGEARIENACYQYKFNHNTNDSRVVNKKFLESIVHIESNLHTIKILKDPITMNVPLRVIPTDELTMDMIASNMYLPKANLSITSQKLYDCISGKNFNLNDNDFPDFSEAIEYNLATPGCWCHEKIKEKSKEFNKDKPNLDETYLRITLGKNNGESPGIPYVMEIWPPGHYSPIHNHAGAEAVIRVLHGQINVSLYPFLCGDNIMPFAKTNFYQDDITWISPTLNQTHKLHNINTITTCITIQCYMYNNMNDTSHYEYFDYLDDNMNILQYEPDSDMDFIEFKKLIKNEWMQQKSLSSDSGDSGSSRWCGW